MSITNVLALLSGLVLFLYGVTLMGDSLNRSPAASWRPFCTGSRATPSRASPSARP